MRTSETHSNNILASQVTMYIKFSYYCTDLLRIQDQGSNFLQNLMNSQNQLNLKCIYIRFLTWIYRHRLRTNRFFCSFNDQVSLTSLARRDLQEKDLSRGDCPADVEPLSLLPLCLSPCKWKGICNTLKTCKCSNVYKSCSIDKCLKRVAYSRRYICHICYRRLQKILMKNASTVLLPTFAPEDHLQLREWKLPTSALADVT